jgi:hypothetical protein
MTAAATAVSKLYQTAGAEFSLDRTYRYALWRVWGEGRRRLVVVGYNPSIADEQRDDPTIRRCVGFAKRERCDGLVMLNLFAMVSMHPGAIYAQQRSRDVVGNPANDEAIHKYGWGDEVIVLAAWGANAWSFPERVRAVRKMLPAMNCLGVTADGSPRHPLYLRADTPFVHLPAEATI